MIYFKDWFYLFEAKKPLDLAKEILDGDMNLLNQIIAILPDGVKTDEKNKYLLIAAYFHKSQNNLETLKNDMDLYFRLVSKNKMKLFTFDDNGVLNPQFKQYDNYLEWTSAMHGMEGEERRKEFAKYRPTDEDRAGLKPLFTNQDGTITVYRANNVKDAIILGKGTSFCISQPGNQMYKSYRDEHVATFYFVFDKNRNDDLDTVVIDVGRNNQILLTDRPNRTGTCQNPEEASKRDTGNHVPYFNYLRRKGVDLSIFKNMPKTAQEKKEDEILGEPNKDLLWFVRLSPEYKGFYIGRGHSLSDEQFDFLVRNKLRSLLEQYCSTGLSLYSDHQRKIVLGDNELAKKYIHNKMIALEQSPDVTLTNDEYEYVKKSKNPDWIIKANNFAYSKLSAKGYTKGQLEQQSIWQDSYQGKPFYIKLFNDKDPEFLKIFKDKIFEKLEHTLHVRRDETGKVVGVEDQNVNIPLNEIELDMLKTLNPEIYNLVIIAMSHTHQLLNWNGTPKDSEITKGLKGKDFEALHPYQKLLHHVYSDDLDSLNALSHDIDDRPSVAKDHQKYRPNYNFDYDRDLFDENLPDGYTLVLDLLQKGKNKTANKILDQEIEKSKNPMNQQYSVSWSHGKDAYRYNLSKMADELFSGNEESQKKIPIHQKSAIIEKLINKGANLYDLMFKRLINFLKFYLVNPFTYDPKSIDDVRNKFNEISDFMDLLEYGVMTALNYLRKTKDEEEFDEAISNKSLIKLSSLIKTLANDYANFLKKLFTGDNEISIEQIQKGRFVRKMVEHIIERLNNLVKEINYYFTAPAKKSIDDIYKELEPKRKGKTDWYSGRKSLR
jgi:hypothetical protein